MTDKYTASVSSEDNLVGVKLLKNGIQCTFEDVMADEGCRSIILDLIVQAYAQGRDKGIVLALKIHKEVIENM